VEFPLAPNEVVTVTGARRAGKTYLLFSMINKILDRGLVSHDEILYADFEDSRLRGVRAQDLDISFTSSSNKPQTCVVAQSASTAPPDSPEDRALY
jgi:predicted AAA+ superfamily ATPase